MILIYGKGKVGNAVAELAEYQSLPYEMLDDSDAITDFSAYDTIIPSPGVPGTHAIYETGKVMAELDFAYQFLPGGFQIVSVTGTDGKSTTSWIMYQILKQEYDTINIAEKEKKVKKSVYLSGNFEVPFSATVLDILKKGEKKGYIVVEISSFMAYAVTRYTSDYTIFTNLKSDHLSWHRDLQEYADAKMNLCLHTSKRSILNQEIFQFATEQSLILPDLPLSRIFGIDPTLRDRTDGEAIIVSTRKKYTLSETHFSGMHNAMNILSCVLVANEMGICSKRTKKYLEHIQGLPHRLEKIGEKDGIIFVEDSKSTSSQSLEAALGSYTPMNNEQGTVNSEKNLLLIVGGSDKGDSFSHLAPRFKSRVKAMACIGATKDQFIKIAQSEGIPHLSTDVMTEAVQWLYEQAAKGDILMLSPGCASFGLFRDYLDRANQFREAVENLIGSK